MAVNTQVAWIPVHGYGSPTHCYWNYPTTCGSPVSGHRMSMYDAVEEVRDASSIASGAHECCAESAEGSPVQWTPGNLSPEDRAASWEILNEEAKNYGLDEICTETWGSAPMEGSDDCQPQSDNDAYSVGSGEGEEANPRLQQQQPQLQPTWYSYHGSNYNYMGYYGGGAHWHSYNTYNNPVQWCWVYPYRPYSPYAYPPTAGYASPTPSSYHWPAAVPTQHPCAAPAPAPMAVNFGRPW